MLDIRDAYADACEAITAQLQALASAEPAEYGEWCDALRINYRVAAVGRLLVDLDSDGFAHMLMRSGHARLFLLQSTDPAAREESRYCRLTRSEGLLDTVAAGDLELAARICAASPSAWAQRYEYEDDYCYVKFLHQQILETDREESAATLQRFGEILEGERTPRLEVCLALQARNNDDFADAFDSFLLGWTDYLEAQYKSIARNDYEYAAAEHVCVEALALLRLAETAGLEVAEEYQYCPREARRRPRTPFPNDLIPG